MATGWRELGSSEASTDLEHVLRELTEGDVEELVLASAGEDRAERELAFGLVAMLHWRADPRLGPSRAVFHDLHGGRIELPELPAPTVKTSDAELDDVMALDVGLRVRVAGGGRLLVGPGRVECTVRVGVEENPAAAREGSDGIRLEVRVGDREGALFAMERTWPADRLLLPLLPLHTWVSSDSHLRRFATGVRCFADHRQRYPVVGSVGHRAVAFAYWAKYLYLAMDLFVEPRTGSAPDLLGVRVHPSLHGAISYQPTPVVQVGIQSLAQIALGLAAVPGRYGPAPLEARRLGGGGRRQQDVVFKP
jgi:hypothetical protein